MTSKFFLYFSRNLLLNTRRLSPQAKKIHNSEHPILQFSPNQIFFNVENFLGKFKGNRTKASGTSHTKDAMQFVPNLKEIEGRVLVPPIQIEHGTNINSHYKPSCNLIFLQYSLSYNKFNMVIFR